MVSDPINSDTEVDFERKLPLGVYSRMKFLIGSLESPSKMYRTLNLHFNEFLLKIKDFAPPEEPPTLLEYSAYSIPLPPVPKEISIEYFSFINAIDIPLHTICYLVLNAAIHIIETRLIRYGSTGVGYFDHMFQTLKDSGYNHLAIIFISYTPYTYSKSPIDNLISINRLERWIKEAKDNNSSLPMNLTYSDYICELYSTGKITFSKEAISDLFDLNLVDELIFNFKQIERVFTNLIMTFLPHITTTTTLKLIENFKTKKDQIVSIRLFFAVFLIIHRHEHIQFSEDHLNILEKSAQSHSQTYSNFDPHEYYNLNQLFMICKGLIRYEMYSITFLIAKDGFELANDSDSDIKSEFQLVIDVCNRNGVGLEWYFDKTMQVWTIKNSKKKSIKNLSL